jgi:hypothetical protein
MTSTSTKEQTICGESIARELIKVSRFHTTIIGQIFVKSFSNNNLMCIGLDGTYNSAGVYTDKMTEKNWLLSGGINMRMDSIIHGILDNPVLNNPFQRFHQTIVDYPDFLDDIDDIGMVEYDQWERLKPFNPKEGTTVGDTFVLPTEDND